MVSISSNKSAPKHFIFICIAESKSDIVLEINRIVEKNKSTKKKIEKDKKKLCFEIHLYMAVEKIIQSKKF